MGAIKAEPREANDPGEISGAVAKRATLAK
jgi:hypothetical protein